jgi:Cd2+/Zn2+-exporting ATPase
MGITGKIDGIDYQAGNLAMMERSGIIFGDDIRGTIHNLEKEGYSVVYLSKNGALAGVATIADTIRSETKQAVRTLKNMGIKKVMMLTGDQPSVAELVASQTGIAEVHAGLMPEEKLQIIENSILSGRKIAMVGDGVNDAPALARATIGVAIGGAGTDVALETADVVLLGNDLSRLVFAVSLSRETRRIIIQNIWIAGLVIVALVGSALAGITSIGSAVVLHEGSTLLVVANALRLLSQKEPIIQS